MQRSKGLQFSQGVTDLVIFAVYQVHPIAAHGRHYKAKTTTVNIFKKNQKSKVRKLTALLP